MARAVTFDFGQVLGELDSELLARKLAARGVTAEPARLDAAVPGAIGAYSRAIHAGLGGHPWKLFMAHVLEGAGVAAEAAGPAIDHLWEQQPKHNLWRRPVPGMIELARELGAAGVPIGVISNSEGKLAELIAELGWDGLFRVVADSGVLGLEKPGPEIFAWTAQRLGAPLPEIVHIGDSFAADVEGALGAGMYAIWFKGDPARVLPERARAAADAAAVRTILAAWVERPGLID